MRRITSDVRSIPRATGTSLDGLLEGSLVVGGEVLGRGEECLLGSLFLLLQNIFRIPGRKKRNDVRM